jgi:hypothetical protein
MLKNVEATFNNFKLNSNYTYHLLYHLDYAFFPHDVFMGFEWFRPRAIIKQD